MIAENMNKSSKRNYVKIPNNCFSGRCVSPFFDIYGGKGLLMLIRMLQQLDIRNTYIITEAHIRDWFQYSKTSYYAPILKILDDFKKNGIFIFAEDYDFSKMYKGLIYYQPSPAFLPEDNYFHLFDDEVDDILVHYKGAEDKHKLLSLFVCLKSYYHTKYKICAKSPSIKTLAEQVHLSENTVQTYLDLLVDMGLILYGNPGTKLFPDGVVRECNNVYTMNYPGNDQVLSQKIAHKRKELIRLEKENKLKIIKNEIAQERKSIKMKLNWLPSKLARGILSQEEYDATKAELQAKYDRLIEKQKSLHD